MVKLEIGPGYSKKKKGYIFNPHYCPDHNVIYLDINPPDFITDKSEWIVADAQHLPFRDSVIDEIFARHVIEHLENPLKFLRESRRVLKKGGTVTVVTPNFLSMNAYLDPDHKHVFNFLKLWRLVKMASLTPHFPSMIGSLLPQKLRLLFKALFLLLLNDLIIIGEKK